MVEPSLQMKLLENARKEWLNEHKPGCLIELGKVGLVMLIATNGRVDDDFFGIALDSKTMKIVKFTSLNGRPNLDLIVELSYERGENRK